MTYKEDYMTCDTKEEMLKRALADIAVAQQFNKDRIPIIYKALEEVLEIKFKEVNNNE